ncbi:MAG: DUF2330 domain-containing protein [Bacillota bacterium]
MLRLLSLGTLVFLAVLCTSSPTSANGCKFPEAAYPAIPSIPTQRALIIHRDGQETLIVESSYDTPSPTVGWVLPLPAEPTKLEVADPGLLTSLSMSLGPRITHDLDDLWTAPALALVFAALCCLDLIATRPPRRFRFTRVALYLVLLLFLASIMLPSLSTPAGIEPLEGVQELRIQRIGSYDVSILLADRAAALSDWLTAKGLQPLPAQAIPIVDDYIARHWCFAVAQLRREGAGAATPHPIQATFPCSSPIYPMRLTSLAPGKTQVELFIIADQQASAPGFHLVAADRYILDSGGPQYSNGAELIPYFRSTATDLIAGHPDVVSLMWNNCIVTRLSAELTPAQMDRDIDLHLAACQPFREHVYSLRARTGIFRSILVYAAFPILGFSTYIFRHRRRPTPGELGVLLALITVSLTAAFVVRVLFPTRDVLASTNLNSRFLGLRSAFVLRDVGVLWNEKKIIPATRPDELLKILHDEFGNDRWMTNPFTGQPPTSERSPGNFSLRTENGQTWFCLYDEHARELRLLLPSNASTAPATQQHLK